MRRKITSWKYSIRTKAAPKKNSYKIKHVKEWWWRGDMQRWYVSERMYSQNPKLLRDIFSRTMMHESVCCKIIMNLRRTCQKSVKNVASQRRYKILPQHDVWRWMSERVCQKDDVKKVGSGEWWGKYGVEKIRSEIWCHEAVSQTWSLEYSISFMVS